jgi:hypothetical protein
MSGYLDRLIARASAPAPVAASASLYDPFEAEEELPPPVPPARPAPIALDKPLQMGPAPRKGIRIRSGELPVEAPTVVPPTIASHSPEQPESPTRVVPPVGEVRTERINPLAAGEEQTLTSAIQSRPERAEADLQKIADRFMAEITGRRVVIPPEPAVPRVQLEEPPTRRVEVMHPRETMESPAPQIAPAPHPQPAPAGPVIGNLTVEVLPPSPTPAGHAQVVRTVVTARSRGPQSGLRSPSRFGLGQL